MPATRRNRTSGGPAAKGAQSTLSFSGNRSKITKPSVPISSKGGKRLVEDVKVEILKTEDPIIAEPSRVISDAEAVEQAKVEPSKPKSEAERLAEKVTDTQIKRYWRGREAERTVERGKVPYLRRLITWNERTYANSFPTVHQEGLSIEEKVLRYFDVSSQYGVGCPTSC
jgi:DNA polymerase delta subunit 4